MLHVRELTIWQRRGHKLQQGQGPVQETGLLFVLVYARRSLQAPVYAFLGRTADIPKLR